MKTLKIHKILRAIAIIITCVLTIFTINNERVFHYTSWWTRIVSRADVASMYTTCLKWLLLIAFVGAIILYVMSIATKYNAVRLVFDCMADSAVVLAVILDIVLTMFLYRGEVALSESKFALVLTLLMLVITLGHFITSKKIRELMAEAGPIEDEKLEVDKNNKVKIAKIINVIFAALIIAPAIMAIFVYIKFLPTYGILGKEPLAYSQELMDEYMNFYYSGVSLGDDLYYLVDEKEVWIYRGESEEPELFYRGEDFYSCVVTDGTYLYLNEFAPGSSIGRINIDTGEYEELLVAKDKNIGAIAVREGVLYYYTDYYDQDHNYIQTIYCIEISDDMDFDNAKVYVDSLADMYISFNPTSVLYLAYVGGNPMFFYDGHIGMGLGVAKYQTMYDGYFYNIAGDTSHYNNGALYRTPSYLVRYKNGDDNSDIMENALASEVTAYNREGEHLYYAVATEEGCEIYESDLDGDNKRCIVSRSDGTRIKYLYTTENHIIYCYSNYYMTDAEAYIEAMGKVDIDR